LLSLIVNVKKAYNFRPIRPGDMILCGLKDFFGCGLFNLDKTRKKGYNNYNIIILQEKVLNPALVCSRAFFMV